METKEVRRIILKDNTSSGGKNLRQQATTATGQLKNAQEIILIGPEILKSLDRYQSRLVPQCWSPVSSSLGRVLSPGAEVRDQLLDLLVGPVDNLHDQLQLDLARTSAG